MLSAIKKKSKGWVAYLIIGILSVPFALFGIQSYLGESNNPAIASVDGEDINATRYLRMLSNEQRTLQEQLGSAYTVEVDNILKNGIINQLIDEQLLDNFAKSQGIATLTEEVQSVINANSNFYVDGVFSRDLYRRLLSLNRVTPAEYEIEQLKALTRDQLRRNLANSSFITSAQAKQLNDLTSQQREISYIALNVDDFVDKVSIDEGQILQYYEENKARFINPAKIKVDFIELSIEQIENPADADEATLLLLYDEEVERFTIDEKRNAQHILLKTKEEADSVLERISVATDFTEMAKLYSTDTSTKEKGGDLGYFERNVMVPEFDSVVFDMNVGETSKVVKSDYGYHIIKLNDIVETAVQPFADIKSELQELYKERITTKELYKLQSELANLAYEEPIDIVANQFELTLQSSEFFTKTSAIYDPLFVNAAYSDVVLQGENSDVLEIGSKFVVLSLSERMPEQQKTLDQVSVEINQVMQEMQAKTIIDELSNDFVEAMSSGDAKTAAAIINENNLSWSEATWISRNSEMPFNITSRAYKIPKPNNGEIVYASGNIDLFNTILIRLTALKQKDEKDGQIANLYSLQEVNEWFAAFINSLRESADIEIFRQLL